MPPARWRLIRPRIWPGARNHPRLLAGRQGDPVELAAALVFLASAAGGYVTGQTLSVDGGVGAKFPYPMADL